MNERNKPYKLTCDLSTLPKKHVEALEKEFAKFSPIHFDKGEMISWTSLQMVRKQVSDELERRNSVNELCSTEITSPDIESSHESVETRLGAE